MKMLVPLQNSPCDLLTLYVQSDIVRKSSFIQTIHHNVPNVFCADKSCGLQSSLQTPLMWSQTPLSHIYNAKTAAFTSRKRCYFALVNYLH